MIAIDLTGKIFGRLRVLRRDKDHRTPKGVLKKYWFCQCECGKEKVIRGDNLIRKENPVISCGCYQKERARENGKKSALPVGEKAFRDVYCHYKYSARIRRLSFNIERDDFLKLTQENCFYCNDGPKSVQKYKKNQPNNYFTYNGLDRIDSNKGYSLDNVVTCCSDCNYAKNEMSQSKFFELVKKIYETRINRKDSSDRTS